MAQRVGPGRGPNKKWVWKPNLAGPVTGDHQDKLRRRNVTPNCYTVVDSRDRTVDGTSAADQLIADWILLARKHLNLSLGILITYMYFVMYFKQDFKDVRTVHNLHHYTEEHSY